MISQKILKSEEVQWILYFFFSVQLSSHHINPEGPVFESEVRKVERHRDDAQEEVCEGQVDNQHVPGGEQDLKHGVDCDDERKYTFYMFNP